MPPVGRPTAQVYLEAIDKAFTSTFNAGKATARKFKSTLEATGRGGAKAFTMIRSAVGPTTAAIAGLTGTVAAVYASFKKLSDFAAVFSKSYETQEQSLMQLESALRATGKNAGTSVKELAAYAAQLQKTTMFGDEATISVARWFGQMRRFPVDRIKQAIALSQDAATVMGEPLEAAARRLMRAFEDPQRASRSLRTAGIMLSTTERELINVYETIGDYNSQLEVVMSAVQRSVGGAATDAASTFRGLRNQVEGLKEDLKEHAGYLVNEFKRPVLEMTKEIYQSWNDYFGMLVGKFKESEEAAKDWVEEMVKAGKTTLTEEDNQKVEEFAKNSVNSFNVAGEAAAQYGKQLNKAAQEIISAVVARSRVVEQLTGVGGLGGLTDASRELQTQKKIGAIRDRFRKELEKKAEREQAELENQQRLRDAAHIEKMNEMKREAESREKERIRKLRQAWNEYWEGLRRRAKGYYESTRTPLEKLVIETNKLKELWARGIMRTPFDAQISWRRMADLRKEYVEEVADPKEIEKGQKKLLDIRKKILEVDEKIKEANTFTSAIEDLRGMWTRIQTAAAGDRKDPTAELREQRKDLEKQAKVRERQLDQLIDINKRARQIAATFG